MIIEEKLLLQNFMLHFMHSLKNITLCVYNAY